MNIGIIGCGAISDQYMIGLNKNQEILKVVACADLDSNKSDVFSKKHKIDMLSVEEIFVNNDIDLIVNLTPPSSHFEISMKSLENGKHVFSEKPVSLSIDEGKKLYTTMKENNVYLFGAPDTYLGPAFKKGTEFLNSKQIGKIIGGSASFITHGVEGWHPNPEFYYKKGGGPLFDMGPYYLTALVNLLGPAKEVFSQSEKGISKRVIGIGPKKGKRFKVECPTTYFSTIKFLNGTIIRLTLSFDVISHLRNHIELYGNEGSMIVPDPNMFGGSVLISKKLGSSWKNFKTNKMTLGKINIRSQSSRANESPTNANYRGVGLSEMISSIQKRKLHKCNGNLSLHVLNIIDAIHNSAKKGKKVKINQLCERPTIFTKKEIKSIIK